MIPAKYICMHRDDEVAVLEFNSEDGYLLRVLEIRNIHLVPYRAHINVENFAAWWRDRAVPKAQGYILEVLRQYNIPTTQSFLLRNLGLSLNDHYWVKPLESSLHWDEVSLFSNNFSESFSVLQDTNRFRSFSPSASTGGDLPKKWVIKGGIRYLIKDSVGLSVQQSLNEVFATAIHASQQQSGRYVPYELIQEKTNGRLACSCACFTSNVLEFIPAWDLVGSESLAKSSPLFSRFIAKAIEGGLGEDVVYSFLDYQIVTDFLLSNVDRHLNNFGVLRDTYSLDFVGMAPIFDSGNSMFYQNPLMAKSAIELLKLQTRGFFTTERRHVEHVRNLGCVDVSLLPIEEDAKLLYAQDKVLHATGYDAIIAQGYRWKVAFLEELQSGVSFGTLYKRICSEVRNGRMY